MNVNSAVPEENQELDDESVMLSISAAGLQRSLQLGCFELTIKIVRALLR